MGANQSNLSKPGYGYDMVVAVTQSSINGIMKEFLHNSGSPAVAMYYVMDDSGNPKAITKTALLKVTGGIDPLAIPAGTPITDAKIQALAKASFWYAFEAKVGLPPGYAPVNPSGPALPDIVEFTASEGMVDYNLTCSEFQVVEASYGPKGIISWLNETQPNGNAWLFNAHVPTSQIPVTDYSNLPSDVKNATSGLSAGTFSVQQLLLDLDKAILNTSATIVGVEPGTPLYNALSSVFLGAYFTQLKASGHPVLNYSIKQASAPAASISVNDLELWINPYVGANGIKVDHPNATQQNLQTLNYLCSTAGNSLAPPAQFTWNWVDENELATTAGVMAIKKSIFVQYLKKELAEIGAGPSLSRIPIPKIHIEEDLSGGSLSLGFVLGESPQFPLSVRSYHIDNTGNTVLNFGWSSSGEDESHGYLGVKLGEFKVKYYANSEIALSGDKITLTNHFVMHGNLNILHVGKADGNWIDVTVTTDYVLGVDASGNLTITQQTPVVGPNNGNTGENIIIKLLHWLDSDITLSHIVNSFASWAETISQQSVDNVAMALNGSRKWVFPGGKTFSFQSTGFSDSQDLVANLLYNSTH